MELSPEEYIIEHLTLAYLKPPADKKPLRVLTVYEQLYKEEAFSITKLGRLRGCDVSFQSRRNKLTDAFSKAVDRLKDEHPKEMKNISVNRVGMCFNFK